MGLTPNDQTQLSLFNTSNPKHQPLMSVVDKLNRAYGKKKQNQVRQSIPRQTMENETRKTFKILHHKN